MVNFNFGSKGEDNEQHAPEGFTCHVKDDEKDITEGLSEAECRQVLNMLGRAVCCFLIVNTITVLDPDRKEERNMMTAVKETFLCRALNQVDKLTDVEKFRKMLPFSHV